MAAGGIQALGRAHVGGGEGEGSPPRPVPFAPAREWAGPRASRGGGGCERGAEPGDCLWQAARSSWVWRGGRAAGWIAPSGRESQGEPPGGPHRAGGRIRASRRGGNRTEPGGPGRAAGWTEPSGGRTRASRRWGRGLSRSRHLLALHAHAQAAGAGSPSHLRHRHRRGVPSRPSSGAPAAGGAGGTREARPTGLAGCPGAPDPSARWQGRV